MTKKLIEEIQELAAEAAQEKQAEESQEVRNFRSAVENGIDAARMKLLSTEGVWFSSNKDPYFGVPGYEVDFSIETSHGPSSSRMDIDLREGRVQVSSSEGEGQDYAPKDITADVVEVLILEHIKRRLSKA